MELKVGDRVLFESRDGGKLWSSFLPPTIGESHSFEVINGAWTLILKIEKGSVYGRCAEVEEVTWKELWVICGPPLMNKFHYRDYSEAIYEGSHNRTAFHDEFVSILWTPDGTEIYPEYVHPEDDNDISF